MLSEYLAHVKEREELGIPPLPLNPEQVAGLVELIKSPPPDVSLDDLLEMLHQRVPPGVDEAAYVKAAFLRDVALENTHPALSVENAISELGAMVGGYNVAPLIELLKCGDERAGWAVRTLSKTLLVFDAFHDITELSEAGNPHAREVLERWAEGEWFRDCPELPERIDMAVFKVPGEVNTDDLSPAQDAWSRPDIPLHALSMLKKPREGLVEDPLGVLASLKKQHGSVVFVADILGTGSSRKSATNSVLWCIGDDIDGIPNRRGGGFCLGSKIAPIFFNTMEDAGALPIECDVSELSTGEVIGLHPHAGLITRQGGADIPFELRSEVLLDSVRAGGRINLIIGRGLTNRAREYLGRERSGLFREYTQGDTSSAGYTLAQKMVGRACGVEGVRPGSYCEPVVSTVGSQDTTGPMTRDELKDLACLGFTSDLVMQSFCHTAAYPKPVDIETQHTLPDFIMNRGGVALRPGDGIIHSWLNRMLLPDQVGTGADSHTRFPLGISFPGGSGLVAFAAALGVMPLEMPESVLVRFSGEMQPGITLRDLVNAIPYAAIQQGLLTVGAENKRNIFSGRCLEVEGLPFLKVEQAFEISDASAERSASGCTIELDQEPIIEYLNSNIVLLRWMIANGYGDARTLERRAQNMEKWLDDPQLMRADADAEYAAVIEIDLGAITEPLLACPNDPDDIKPLSEVQNDPIHEVFIGSCMTNIGHFRAAGELLKDITSLDTRLWICPPTRMDQHQLTEEGYYGIFGRAGARTEMPGCSLCMGNQARVESGCTVVSTSTRNFPNRLGDGANVYLASAELAAVSSVLGRLPTPEEYLETMADIDPMDPNIYRYLNFNEIDSFQKSAEEAKRLDITNIVQVA